MSLASVILDWGGVEVTAMDVYTDLFRLGTNEIQQNGEEKGLFKANPLGYWKNNGNDTGHYRIMFDDDFATTLQELQEADFAILNGISYFGRRNIQQHASKMYGMIFDIDGVTDKTLIAFLSGAFRANVYPVPNYIILSGHGIHLYYIFEYPVPLYPNIKIQLKNLKYALIEKMWNRYTSTEKKKQFQGINQGFRVIGGKTKIDGVRVRAFQLHLHPFNLEQLGQYVPQQYRIDETKLFPETKMTLAEAKKKFPEWYEKRVLNHEEKGKWTCKRDLYDWWIRQIHEGTVYGHRYFAIMCLAIYAVKCGISFDEVKQDAFELIPLLDDLNPNEPFTETDVLSALECYDERYVRFPRDDISKLSGIQIQPNKRNGRKQSVHLARMRALQAVDYPEGEWRNREGRPTAQETVRTWQEQHPDGRKIDCIHDTGLSKPTVYKWWDC